MIRLSIQTGLCLATSLLLSVQPSIAQEKSFLGGFKSQTQKNVWQKAPYKLAQQIDKKKVDPQDAAKKDLAPKKAKPQPSVSIQRRKELIEFFKANHPELQRLVSLLQKTRPSQYQSILRSLDREVRSLQAQEKNSSDRFKKSLELWKVKTDIRVQTAHLARKLKKEDKDKIRKKLRSLIEKQHALKVEQVSSDLDSQIKKMERMKKQLSDLESDRDNQITRQMESLDKSAQRISAQHRKSIEAKKKKQPKTDAKKPEKVKDQSKPPKNKAEKKPSGK